MTLSSTPQKIAQNTTFLYIRMLVVMILNIISVRYVLKGLGVVDYGIFNVVAGLVTMFSSLSGVMSSATLRFHSYAIGENDENKVSDVFTVSLNVFVFLAVFIFVIGEILGLWFIRTQSDIPFERHFAAQVLFHLSMLTFVFGLITAPFTSIVMAFEKMKEFSIISVVDCSLKFLLAICLTFLNYDHLIVYGIGLLGVSFVVFFLYVRLSRKVECSFIYKKKAPRQLYKDMLTFSGWTLFSSSAGIGISQLVTLITNVFFGPIVNAARGIAFQVSTALSSFTGNIITAIRPPMIKSFAEGKLNTVNTYFNFSNKAIFYSLLVVLLPLFFETETVLKLWLDTDDIQTVLFVRLILIYALILSLNNPISVIVQATGNIRDYSIFVEIPTILCFPITWLFYYLGFPAEYAFYIMILAIIISHIIRLICLKRVFPLFSYRLYFKGFVVPAFFILAVDSVFLYYIHTLFNNNVLRLVIIVFACGFSLLGLCFCFGFSKNERNSLFALLKINKS